MWLRGIGRIMNPEFAESRSVAVVLLHVNRCDFSEFQLQELGANILYSGHGKRFGDERLEKACSIALAAGATRYQQVEAILKNKIDLLNAQAESQNNVVSLHQNIRGSNYYK